MDALFLLVPFIVVACLGPWVVEYCRRHEIVAAVDARRSHTVPTPHGGGMLVVGVAVPAMMLAIWGSALWGGPVVPFREFLTVMLLASVMVAWVGWVEDHTGVHIAVRLGIHLLAVAAGLVMLPELFDFMPLVLEKLLLLLAWGWFVNLFNFMDGSDGLSNSEAVAIGLGVTMLAPPLAPVVGVVMGACLGFLRVNWAPAKVFIGDVGSTWLGYVLGGLLLVALIDDTWNVVWPLATITLVFSVDATWTLVRRIAQGHRPWVPHRTFWFQRFLGLGYSHKTLALGVAAINIGLLTIAVAGHAGRWGWVTLALGLVWVGMPMLFVRLREKALGIRPFGP